MAWRTAAIRAVLLVSVVLIADPGLAAKKKNCKKLCRSEVSACVATTCAALPRKLQRPCRRGCKRTTIAACRLDQDTTRCSAPGGEGDAAKVMGRVLRQEPGQQVAVPVPDAQVRAGVDMNADGALAGDEAVTTATAVDGAYRLEMTAVPGKTAVVQFRAQGAVPVIKTLRLVPGADVLLDVSLRDIASLQCTGDRCVGVDDKLGLFGAPANAQAAARVFDPSQESDAAPGGSLDRSGQLLRSATFAVVELTDGTTGQPITTLPSPAELCLAVPPDTRSVLTDIAPGTGQIEMPLFSFDEAGGAWNPEGQAVLKDRDVVIPETALGDVRAGTFPGAVQACGMVNHLSFWNVALPSGQPACLSLDLRDASGAPAAGATAFFAGASYFGLSDVLAADASGNVCGVVPRSEAPGEDLDGNGIAGEEARTRIRVQFGDKTFDGGEVVDDVAGGSCPCPARTITLSDANQLSARVCTVTGRVLDQAGAPVTGAEVAALDSSITSDVFLALCGQGQCSFVTFTAADGTFTVTSPVLNQLEVIAFSLDPQLPGTDQRTFPGCPPGPIDLVLE